MTRRRGSGGTNYRSCKAWDDRLKRDVSGRRSFLVSASGFAVAVPFLESFFGSNKALGAAGRRFIAIHNGHGQFNDQWHPDPSKFTWTRHNAHMRSGYVGSSVFPKWIRLLRLDDGQVRCKWCGRPQEFLASSSLETGLKIRWVCARQALQKGHWSRFLPHQTGLI